eukprot:3619831-Amphidinium_carterae.1
MAPIRTGVSSLQLCHRGPLRGQLGLPLRGYFDSLLNSCALPHWLGVALYIAPATPVRYLPWSRTLLSYLTSEHL